MQNGDRCDHQTFVYTEEMDKMGVIGFKDKLDQVTENKVKWDIDEANATDAK